MTSSGPESLSSIIRLQQVAPNVGHEEGEKPEFPRPFLRDLLSSLCNRSLPCQLIVLNLEEDVWGNKDDDQVVCCVTSQIKKKKQVLCHKPNQEEEASRRYQARPGSN